MALDKDRSGSIKGILLSAQMMIITRLSLANASKGVIKMEAANMSPMMHNNKVMGLIRNAICFLLCENVDKGSEIFVPLPGSYKEGAITDIGDICHKSRSLIGQNSSPSRKLMRFSIISLLVLRHIVGRYRLLWNADVDCLLYILHFLWTICHLTVDIDN